MLLPPPPPGAVLKERDPRFEAPSRPGKLVLGRKDSGSAESDCGSSVEQVMEPPPALEAEQAWIEAGIAKLGGMVVPRLSWTTPHDAAWINGGEVQCGSVGEVLTVLKASDDITEALESYSAPEGSDHAGAAATGSASDEEPACPVAMAGNHELLLVRFSDLFAQPGHCFRVFVHHGRAIGVSQRAIHTMFPAAVHRADEAGVAASQLVAKLVAKPVPLPDGTLHTLRTFAADFALTPKGAARLLDMQPWNGDLDTLLFSTEELEAIATGPVTSSAAADTDADADADADDMPELEAMDDAACSTDARSAGDAVMSTEPSSEGVPEVRVRLSDGKLTERSGRSMEHVPMPAELAMLLGQSESGTTDEGRLIQSLNEALKMAQAARDAGSK